MLVKHRVVGVIAPRPPDLIRTEECLTTLRQTRGHRAERAASRERHARRRNASISFATRARATGTRHSLPLCMGHELRPVERDEVVLGHVIAECIEEPRRHHLGACGKAFVPDRVKAQHVERRFSRRRLANRGSGRTA